MRQPSGLNPAFSNDQVHVTERKFTDGLDASDVDPAVPAGLFQETSDGAGGVFSFEIIEPEIPLITVSVLLSDPRI